jgi:outer membrane protein assembly factor BamA
MRQAYSLLVAWFEGLPRNGRGAGLSLIAFWLALGAAVMAQAPAQEKPTTAPIPPGMTDASTQPVPGTAQAAEEMFSTYEGQNVDSVEIAGQPALLTSQFAAEFKQKTGQPFSKDLVNQTAAALKAAGQGKFTDVRIHVTAEAQGVRVQFILEPAYYFGVFAFPGASVFPYSRLIQVSNYPVQTPYDADEVERDRRALVQFFQQEGYFEAQVRSQVVADEQHAIASISFVTKLGRKAKFGDVSIAGLPDNDQHEMENSLKTLLARFREAAVRPGKAYHHSTLLRANKYLQSELEKRGLLGAKVKLAGAEYRPDTNRADIHFAVDPGPKVHVDIAGAHLWSWDRKSLLPMYQGVGVDEETVEEGRQALTSYYQGKGYFDVKVDAKLSHGTNGDTVLYQISRASKEKVAAVDLKGNEQLKSSELTPVIAVEPKHFLSAGKFSNELVETSENNLTGVYKSEGFSSVKVTSKVTRHEKEFDVAFAVTEGPRDTVASLQVEGAGTFPPSRYAPHGMKLRAGSPYSAANVAADRTMIVANYLRAGYLKASFRETAAQASKNDPHHVNVVYHISEGPRVIAGDVLTLGRAHTQQKLIDRDVTGIKPEQPLTETSLLASGAKLYDHTGVFDWAEVDPKRGITTQNTEDVLVKVHEAPRNSITYGIGFEVINRGGSIPSGTVALPKLPPVGLPSNFTTSQKTFWGPRGTIEYTRNNVRGKDESLSFTGFAGRLDQSAKAYYIDPTFFWSPWKTTSAISYEKNEENPIFSYQQELGSEQIQRAVLGDKQNILFLQYGFTQTDLTHVLIPALVPDRDLHIRLSTLTANLTRDTRDNPLDEHRGMLGSAELDFNTTKLGSNVDFAKFTGQAASYKTKWHDIVWANSIRIGLAQPFANSFVPLSESFFTGGGNSLRGFPLDGAGPQRQVQVCSSGSSSACTFIQVPAGGNEMLILNAEARIPLPIKKGLRIVPFYDGGNVFPLVGFHDFTSLYANNVGVGLRYDTPVGPIRFDLGQNLNPVSGVNSTQYFISIGQAF